MRAAGARARAACGAKSRRRPPIRPPRGQPARLTRALLRPHADRRGPGALLVRREAVVVEGRAVVAVAGVDLHAVAVLERAAEVRRVDGGGRLLDRPHVVDGLARAGHELRILELDDAAGGAGRAREGLPGVVDEIGHGLFGPQLRADAHHLDARDSAALLAGGGALAAAEGLQALRRERLARELGAARGLLEGAARAHAEARREGERGRRSHRDLALGCVHEIEPEQDALAARAVDLAATHGAPDRVAIAPRRA